MFHNLTIRGARASLVYGYQRAALLRDWTITKRDGPDPSWHLTAHVERADLHQCRQPKLLFTAPRAGGSWCFPLLTLEFHGVTEIAARLGPPEQ